MLCTRDKDLCKVPRCNTDIVPVVGGGVRDVGDQVVGHVGREARQVVEELGPPAVDPATFRVRYEHSASMGRQRRY